VSVAVVGGGLQGIEATYLAHKAGWKVTVIDKKKATPASGLSDGFIQLDVTSEEELSLKLKDIDLVIPATENDEALAALTRWTELTRIAFAFDPRAYSISSSKVKSDQLFARKGFPSPMPWPESGFPVVTKPNRGSGSAGVRIIHDKDDLKFLLSSSDISKDWVLQEYLWGPSYSLEVLGVPGRYTAVQVTDLAMDESHDCKRVIAPTDLSPKLVKKFEDTSLAIAEEMELRGLMDVEVILHEGQVKVLEVDARLPSQTPTAVYWSTGFNIVEALGEIFLNGYFSLVKNGKKRRGVVYEHIKVSPNVLEICGEHIMTGVGPLQLKKGFFEADEAITNYCPTRKEWVATIIVSGTDQLDAWSKRCEVIEEIRKRFALDIYLDPTPQVNKGN
jgi:pyrrolysine biosynthesis protein PylC